MSVKEKIKIKPGSFEISTKITFIYAACFIALLIIINAAMWMGVMTALYRPAERAIRYSMGQIENVFEKLEENYDAYNPATFRGALVAGVVLRVVDERGNIFINTDEKYPSINRFEEDILVDPPSLAAEDFEIARIGNSLVYRAEMNYTHEDRTVTLYFFRTITSELKLFDELAKILLGLDIFGIIAALLLGRYLSRKILTPIKTMNELAREIAFDKMNGRIPLGKADDELNDLAQTLNEMLDRLQGGINKQQKFVSDASHELRTPATVIAGYIEMLKKYGTDDKELLNESIAAISSEARNMQMLLENMLFISRTDQKRQKLNKKNLDLDDIVGDVITKMKIAITTHKVELIKNDPAKIYGDETMIKQMIRVFLDNAVKYTPEGGSIKINSEVKDEKILLSISDTGIGIAPENLNKIFDRFFRIDSEDLVSSANGNGLGLSIAKWIADAHKITISVESERGAGTTFMLNIPLADR